MVPKVTPSPAGLLLLTSFLLHMEEGHANLTRLVCDNRLIQKYIGEAKDMEKKAVRIQSLSALNPRPGRGTAPGTSPWHLLSPLGPVPGTAHTQLPHGAALGGLQPPAVEIQIGERGWEDGAGTGVPMGLEKESPGWDRHQKCQTRCLWAHLVAQGGLRTPSRPRVGTGMNWGQGSACSLPVLPE